VSSQQLNCPLLRRLSERERVCAAQSPIRLFCAMHKYGCLCMFATPSPADEGLHRSRRSRSILARRIAIYVSIALANNLARTRAPDTQSAVNGLFAKIIKRWAGLGLRFSPRHSLTDCRASWHNICPSAALRRQFPVPCRASEQQGQIPANGREKVHERETIYLDI
jgi:hypothetical protein